MTAHPQPARGQQTYTSRNASRAPAGPRCVPSTASSLDVHEGETLAIVGESGSGKSTLAKLLLMLNRRRRGEVRFRGRRC
jgi:ABC-type glutathione transport system ATPase component